MVVRDFNRDASSRASLLFLKCFNAAVYYEPIYDVLQYGFQLGYGNSHFEYIYRHIDNTTSLHNVLMPGKPTWSEFDSALVSDILDAHSICERVKIEVWFILFQSKLTLRFPFKSLYCRYSRMLNLTRLFSQNESQQGKFPPYFNF